jgi:hypothetical protein
MRRIAGAALAIGASAALAAQSAAPEPTLADVLKLTAAYVADYEARLAGIVAEEHYSQSVTRMFPSPGQRMPPTPQQRALKSDVLLVRPEGEDRWVQFRDVFEVDGRPVRDRDQRLFKLFIEPASGSRAAAEAISAESARFNIGPLWRTVNVPILALVFFEARHQPQFRHRRTKAGNLDDLMSLARASDIWAIDYRETASRTLVRGASDRNVRSNGVMWIDATNGRVLKSEMEIRNSDVRARIVVTYRSEPGVDLFVPGEMKEGYMLPRSMMRIEGTARYSHFRQFKVVTTEKTKQ